jgi:hypothetical protein
MSKLSRRRSNARVVVTIGYAIVLLTACGTTPSSATGGPATSRRLPPPDQTVPPLSTAAGSSSPGHPLQVDVTGTEASDVVTDASGQVSCPSDCLGWFPPGETVTLTAVPTAADGAVFVGWTSGPCPSSTDPSCRFTMSQQETVTAQYEPPPDPT